MSFNGLNKAPRRWLAMSMTWRLIAVNVAVFLVIRFLAVIQSFNNSAFLDSVIDTFALSQGWSDLLHRPWTLVTYMWVHYDVLHLLFNMLALLFFGRLASTRLPGAKLVMLYLYSGIAGGLTFLTIGNFIHHFNGILIGASGAVMGVLGATAILFPDYKVNIILKFHVALKWIAVISIAIFTLGLWGSNSAAHLCHLGGLAMGCIIGIMLAKGIDICAIPPFRFKRSNRHRSVTSPATPPESSLPIETILAKVRQSGYASLTSAERKQLFQR